MIKKISPLFKKLDCYSMPVGNLDLAISFYQKLGHQLIWRDGDHAAGFQIPNSDSEIVVHTNNLLPETYFLVDSVASAIIIIEKAGGKLVAGPNEIRVGLYAKLYDPWQNPLVILDYSKGTLKTDKQNNVGGNEISESKLNT